MNPLSEHERVEFALWYARTYLSPSAPIDGHNPRGVEQQLVTLAAEVERLRVENHNLKAKAS